MRHHAAELLASFAIAAGPFPSAVVEQAKRLILDQLGCEIAGAGQPWSASTRSAVLSLGPGSGATILCYGDTVAVDQAAFVNGAFGHALEFDDTHLASQSHVGAVIVPAVLALAEQQRLSGQAVVDAVIVGAEVLMRIGTAAAPHVHQRGHHAVVAVGAFGAAAACSRLLGLDAGVCAQALGIAGSHAGGLLEYARAGGSVKRVHCAIPAMNGVRSALLAAHGLTGPASVLEGARGFFTVFGAGYDPAPLHDDLGTDFVLQQIAYKPVAAGFPAHAALELIGALVDEYRLEAAQIVSIRVGMAHSNVQSVGLVKTPHDLLGAQVSVAFSLAVRLLRGGNGIADYRQEDLADPRFVELANRVTVVVDPECEAEYTRLRNLGAVVALTITDGRTFERRTSFSKGLPENPLANDELAAKFLRNVGPVLGAERAEALAERIWTLDALADASAVPALTLRR